MLKLMDHNDRNRIKNNANYCTPYIQCNEVSQKYDSALPTMPQSRQVKNKEKDNSVIHRFMSSYANLGTATIFHSNVRNCMASLKILCFFSIFLCLGGLNMYENDCRGQQYIKTAQSPKQRFRIGP